MEDAPECTGFDARTMDYAAYGCGAAREADDEIDELLSSPASRIREFSDEESEPTTTLHPRTTPAGGSESALPTNASGSSNNNHLVAARWTTAVALPIPTANSFLEMSKEKVSGSQPCSDSPKPVDKSSSAAYVAIKSASPNKRMFTGSTTWRPKPYSQKLDSTKPSGIRRDVPFVSIDDRVNGQSKARQGVLPSATEPFHRALPSVVPNLTTTQLRDTRHEGLNSPVVESSQVLALSEIQSLPDFTTMTLELEDLAQAMSKDVTSTPARTDSPLPSAFDRTDKAATVGKYMSLRRREVAPRPALHWTEQLTIEAAKRRKQQENPRAGAERRPVVVGSPDDAVDVADYDAEILRSLPRTSPIRCFASYRLLQNAAVDRGLYLCGVDVIHEADDPTDIVRRNQTSGPSIRTDSYLTEPDLVLSPRSCVVFYQLSAIYKMTEVLTSNGRERTWHHQIIKSALETLHWAFDKVFIVFEAYDPPTAQATLTGARNTVPEERRYMTPAVSKSLEKLRAEIVEVQAKQKEDVGSSIEVELLFARTAVEAGKITRQLYEASDGPQYADATCAAGLSYVSRRLC